MIRIIKIILSICSLGSFLLGVVQFLFYNNMLAAVYSFSIAIYAKLAIMDIKE